MSRKSLKFINSEQYWRSRANRPGQKSVMWRNETYNKIFRLEETKILKQIFHDCLRKDLTIIEYGCGIGVFTKIITETFPNSNIIALDYEEMINIAKVCNSHPRITYIESSAEKFMYLNESVDIIISSGCFSSIIDKSKLKIIFKNCFKILKPNGKILLIDPFHKFKPLARVNLSSNELISWFSKLKLTNIYYSGISFWPVRMLIANSTLPVFIIQNTFFLGEKILKILGKKFWSDYKILLFQKMIE